MVAGDRVGFTTSYDFKIGLGIIVFFFVVPARPALGHWYNSVTHEYRKNEHEDC